jgi:large conductance mechanosensitive channel
MVDCWAAPTPTGGRQMLKEFKEFAFKGNLIEIAVGLVLALAFVAVVTALVDGVIMPIVAAIFGKPNFDDITFTIGDGVVRIGTFITALVNFLIIAWVLFLIVKAANRLMPKKDEEAAPTEIELLTEIRDSLRTRNV